MKAVTVPADIFRAYDIRGIVPQQLNEDIVFTIAQAIASEALAQQQPTIIVGYDGRLSSPSLSKALMAGILATGCDVIDIGGVPSPVLYFATHTLATRSGVMLTGSHNPANYNGLKIVLDGNTLAEQKIQALYQRIQQRDIAQGHGQLSQYEIIPAYIARIASGITLKRQLKIVIDCGNGIAGNIAPSLFRQLGCEVIELFCDVDGHFPHHHPDPTIAENLQALINEVKAQQADIGFAFDGDADRVGMVTNLGEIIWPDRQMILLAKDVLSRQPGATIVFDVKCSSHLPQQIHQAGGKPLMCQTGHSLLKRKMLEVHAALAGELSGHIFFRERWYGFDDGLYAAARLLEILSQYPGTVSELFATIPNSVNTPEIKVAIDEQEKFHFIQALIKKAAFPGAKKITIDGLRIEYADGWGLIRASNTTPCITLRFEANNAEALARIQQTIREQLFSINPHLILPF